MPELIDKCVGSRIWVVMKGDKGEQDLSSSGKNVSLTQIRVCRHVTGIRRLRQYVQILLKGSMSSLDMVLEDVIELWVSPWCTN
jgi:hypothetical protein